MKLIFFAIAAFFTVTATLTAHAQTTAPPIAAPQAVPIKLAVIDTDAFADPKTGIKRLINAYTQIDTELTPIRQEIITKNNRLQALAQKANAGPLTAAETEEVDTLKRDIQRRQEDGQKTLGDLTKKRIDPINNDIANAVQAYAKQHGYDVVLDASKFVGTMIVTNPALDITSAFVADYNSRNPAATPPKTP